MDISRKDFEETYVKEIDGKVYWPKYSYLKYEDDVYYGMNIEKTAEEMANKIDNCSESKHKTLDELTKENEQLWETVQFLLKNNGFIPKEANDE